MYTVQRYFSQKNAFISILARLLLIKSRQVAMG